jgi:hypothetical protein
MIREILELAAKSAPDGDDQPGPGIFRDVEGMNYLVERIRSANGQGISFLRILTDDYWYWHDAGAVYPIGGAFADFVIRKYGTKRFVALYLGCRPGQFEEVCRRELGVDLWALELDFWREVNRIANTPALPKQTE